MKAKRSLKQIPEAIRRAVLERDGYRCQLCGSMRDLHLHHVLFRSHGGAHHPDNLMVVCWRCHNDLHRGNPG